MKPKTLIVGAGPAGMAAGRWLSHAEITFDHVDRHHAVGGMWDQSNPGSPLYDALRPITSRVMSGFIDCPMGTEGYPTRFEMLEYLQKASSAETLTARFQGGVEARQIMQHRRGGWICQFSGGAEDHYDTVFIAQGFHRQPLIPHGYERFRGAVIHSSTYKNGAAFAGQHVLIIGSGNSAFHIACDASLSCKVSMSVSRGSWFAPLYEDGAPTDYPVAIRLDAADGLEGMREQKLLAEDLQAYNNRFSKCGLPAPEGLPLEHGLVLCSEDEEPLLQEAIEFLPAVVSAEGYSIEFADGRKGRFDLIILATGFVAGVPLLGTMSRRLEEETIGLCHLSMPGMYLIGNISTDLGGFWLYEIGAQLAVGIAARSRGDLTEVTPEALIPYSRLNGGINFRSGGGRAPMVHGRTYLRAAKRAAAAIGMPLKVHPAWEDML